MSRCIQSFATAITAAAVLLGGCRNMKKQPNFRAMEPNPHFANGTTAHLPPANTVPRGASFDPLPAGPLDQIESLTALPVPLTRELLQRGQERFDIYCAVCHGPDGYGRGIVPRRGFPAPPSFHDDRLRSAPIGHFYAVMTRGYGVMYSYADRVPAADRWAIAAYIRALQRSQHATLADVPPDARSQLGSP